MNLLNNLQEIREIVERKAKYQKVMLIYDNHAKSNEMLDIYENIKDICVFNKISINSNIDEIYNGYKVLIFCVSSDSFLNFRKDIREFVNIFVNHDGNFLPFYLDCDLKISSEERYLLIDKNSMDVAMVSSICFNRFYAYLNDLLYYQTGNVKFDFFNKEITQHNVVDELNNIVDNFTFVDLKIIQEKGLKCDDIILIDFILICAFLTLIFSVGNKTYELVDTYKICKDNQELIDKFYALQTNQALVRFLELNYNFLITACKKTKEIILDLMPNVNEDKVLQLIDKVKSYSKECDNILAYLYLYNIFDY